MTHIELYPGSRKVDFSSGEKTSVEYQQELLDQLSSLFDAEDRVRTVLEALKNGNGPGLLDLCFDLIMEEIKYERETRLALEKEKWIWKDKWRFNKYKNREEWEVENLEKWDVKEPVYEECV